MNELINVVRLIAVHVIVNFISCTFLAIRRFRKWDITAAVLSITLSILIVLIEVLNKWHCRCRSKQLYRHLLVISVLLGGASSFFWFFQLIYKVGHYQGDISEMTFSSVTTLVVFAVSVHLVVAAHNRYSSMILKFDETKENPLYNDAAPFSITELTANYVIVRQNIRLEERPI